MTNGQLLQKAKTALRLRSAAFDDEILDILNAAQEDLATRGVVYTDITPMILRAILTYTRMHFGQPDDYDKLKESYANQLGQLMTTTGYTRWDNGSE